MAVYKTDATDGSPDYFWYRVKQLLKAHKISQRNFATHIEIPVDTFIGWIRYDRIPGAFTACKIAESLDVTVEYLVRGKDRINAKNKMRLTLARKTASNRIKKLAQQIEQETAKLRE